MNNIIAVVLIFGTLIYGFIMLVKISFDEYLRWCEEERRENNAKERRRKWKKKKH